MIDLFIRDVRGHSKLPRWFSSIFKMIMNPKSGSLIIQLPDGRKNIRLWDGDTRLTTWFDVFLPSYDYSNSPEAITQVVDDAIWWVKTYNIDGFRQDAVKQLALECDLLLPYLPCPARQKPSSRPC